MTPTEIHELVGLAQEEWKPYPSMWLKRRLNEYMEHISTRFNYYKFLYLLVQRMKPDVMLEIGVEYGLASGHMAIAARDYGGQAIGIDLHYHHIPGKQLTSHCPNFSYLVGDSTSTDISMRVKEYTDWHGNIGLVFQDSSHHYAPSVMEWDTYSRMLMPGAIWVCDDITSAFYEEGVDEKSMVTYFDELPGTKLKFKDVLHYGNTMGVVLT